MGESLTERFRVLYIDDSAEVAEVTAAGLQRADERFAVETATATDWADHLADGIDCVVSEYRDTARENLELLEAVREEYPELPFILITGEEGDGVASAALSAGATDYFRRVSSEKEYALLANRIVNAVRRTRTREDSVEHEHERRTDAQAPVIEQDRVVREMNELAVIVQDEIIRYASPGVSELFGYPEDYPVGRRMTEFVAPESRDSVQARHQAWMGGDGGDHPNRYELEMLAEDGTKVPVEVNVSGIEYRGQPATLSILRDITERKHQEQRFQAFIEHSTDIISVLDPSGTYKYQSPSSQRVLGYDSQGMIGDNAFDYVHPDDRGEIIQTFSEAVNNPEMSPHVEYRFRHSDGSWRWMESVGNNQLDNPAIEGFVVNSRDITERKQKEQQLQRQNERLDRFASVISHDLRNPLSVARGQLELLRETCDSDRIDSIGQAHERMERLIDEVLTLAREGKPISEPEPVNLAAIAERGWQSVSTADGTLSIETEQSVLVDPSRLQQLLENLFRNAIEHGGRNVTVTVTSLDGKSGFAVADDGPGIPQDERDNIFEAGYSTTESGTGFGLSIVREITQAHNWDIRITESQQGGARFEITGVDTAAR